MSRESVRARAIERCRLKGIVIPTFEEMRYPSRIPSAITNRLPGLDMQAVDPLNLFRITWHNDPSTGGLGPVGALEIPSSITGVDTRIVGLVGKHFPTGAHKVGAAFGCLAPRLVRGEFDPESQLAVWPSTGNYCRGGVFDSALLGCDSIAILPEEMSQERFQWLRSMGCEIIATPGCESNVKEIFDECTAIKAARPEVVVFNQFEEFGNYLWHYGVTGPAVASAFDDLRGEKDRLSAWVSATGSAGTIAAGDYLKQRYPGAVITAAEALQCPTLLLNGFGAHRIEGIGDKHVPWIHNVRNTDVVTAIDDEATVSLLRLFNDEVGWQELQSRGVSEEVLEKLPLLGISGICNLLAAIRTAKVMGMGPHDVIFTSFTDSVELYGTRLQELREERGPYTSVEAAADFARYLEGLAVEHTEQLTEVGRQRIHNLKYFTWVEQQGKTVEELNALWEPSFWRNLQEDIPQLDEDIRAFNRDTGVA